MTALLHRCEAALGRAVTLAAAAAVVAGILAFATGVVSGQAAATGGALAGAWLYFAGLAFGGVAASATIRAAQGRWAARLAPAAEAAGAFALPAAALLVLVLAVGRFAFPALRDESTVDFALLAARNVAAAVLLAWVGRAYLRAERTTARAVRFLLVYVVALSVFAVDLVMGLSDWAPSTITPALYFMSAVLSGVALATFASALRAGGLDPDGRHDAGKLLFALLTFWAYLVWSAYLPVWYGHLPDETGLLLARWKGLYRPAALLTIAGVAFVPFVALFLEGMKRRRGVLAFGAASVLVGLFAQALLFVLPSLNVAASAMTLGVGVLVCAGVGGAFLLSYGAALAPARG